jgi:hypothetical protein
VGPKLLGRELRDMRSKGAALALTLSGVETDFSLPEPTLLAIRPCAGNAPEPSRRRPQRAAFSYGGQRSIIG